MEKENYVLAMYDVRGKQDYIFRGNKIKEIVGGSLVIRDIYKDYLLKEENKIINDMSTDFSWNAFVGHMEAGYNGEVIYDGGGNFLILFKNESTFNEITHKFTLEVLRETASLRVIGTCVKVTGPADFEKDRKALYEKHRITENTIQNVPRYASLPISLVHPESSLPIVYRGNDYTKELSEFSAEQLAKYKKYKACMQNSKDKVEFDEKILDKIAPEKGTDSHIAVIYIDGNSMGAKVQKCTNGKKTYDESVNALRKFSENIQKECIDDKKEIIDKKLTELYPDSMGKRRLILGAGDEINMIVAGKDAFDVAKAYLEALSDDFSSCAGIAVFKSHMPYADAYRIAEECCESGKDKMKSTNVADTSFLDFHLCQGAIDVSLEQIRRDEETEETSRPWLITDNNNECSNEHNEHFDKTDIFNIDEVTKVISFLQKIGHGNVKGLRTASREGISSLQLELKRIKAHQKKETKDKMAESWSFIENMDKARACRTIYDIALMYDLWFRKGEA